jgi:hypothetical protein
VGGKEAAEGVAVVGGEVVATMFVALRRVEKVRRTVRRQGDARR